MTHPNRDYLRKLRQDAGLTQAALAKQIGIGESTLSTYEHNGRPVPPGVLAAIEAACGVPSHAGLNRAAAPPVLQDQDDSPDAPLVVVDQRTPLEPPAAATYTLADLEGLAHAYWERTFQEDVEGVAQGVHPCMLDDTEGILWAFLVFLAGQEAEARATQAFATACASLTLTGDLGAYTAAVVAARDAGLTPARIAALMRAALLGSETRLRFTLLHPGNAPVVPAQSKEAVHCG